MRSQRLLSCLLLLQGKPRVTARELARQLEVSMRTIFRDVEQRDVAVRIGYRDGNGAASERRVDPLGLVAKAGVWYFIAREPVRRPSPQYSVSLR